MRGISSAIFLQQLFQIQTGRLVRSSAEQPMKSSEPVLHVEYAGSVSDFLQAW